MDDYAAYLGLGIDRTHLLFVARFEGDRDNTYWHGYPADHTRRTDDIPTERIALQWIAKSAATGRFDANRVAFFDEGNRPTQ